MDRVSIVKRQFRMEEWRKRIAECQASGIPVSHWCKQNGYCEQTYYKYLKRIREEMVDAHPAPNPEMIQAFQSGASLNFGNKSVRRCRLLYTTQ